jgi:hypothetical protein
MRDDGIRTYSDDDDVLNRHFEKVMVWVGVRYGPDGILSLDTSLDASIGSMH